MSAAAGRDRSAMRLALLGLGFVLGFSLIGLRMAVLAGSEPEARRGGSGEAISSARADIVDRAGRLLATNLETASLYARPHEMVDIDATALALREVLPELPDRKIKALFREGAKFVWLQKVLSPEQRQAVHDIGSPGLLFGAREMRLYPNGALAAHVLGGARFGAEGVSAAEVLGVGGVERAMDARLRERPDEPLRLTLDLSIQAIVEEVLGGGMTLLNAAGAAAVVMDVRTGEIVAVASLPDFDPNDRPPPPVEGDPSEAATFNRAVQGVYELGSVFKAFTTANALELGLVSPGTMIDTKGPMRSGRHTIRDYGNYGDVLSVTDVMVHSSNIGTARMALAAGANRHAAFLEALGFAGPLGVELSEARTVRTGMPERWPDITVMTSSYGHGVSVTPLHVAAAYATLTGDGTLVLPTLLPVDPGAPRGERIVSEQTARQMRAMLRAVVTEGTASMARIEGYAIGGKTGTADKVDAVNGGYLKDRNINTFAAVFPALDPQYVIVVTFDEGNAEVGHKSGRNAGLTAVPVAAEIVRRVAPLLGIAPEEALLAAR